MLLFSVSWDLYTVIAYSAMSFALSLSPLFHNAIDNIAKSLGV
jgi:hypothetical protein